jgi:hypothetical protein
MATTTNYSWTTPDDTDLVKDGAAAIRTLGTAIDSTVFTNAGAAIAKTIVDAKGDIIAATAADTVDRLAVGANDTVLTADSSTATGLKWALPASGGMNLLSTTTLSGATTTISSIDQTYNSLLMIISGVTNATADGNFRCAPNALTNISTSFGTNGTGSVMSNSQSYMFFNTNTILTRTVATNSWVAQIFNYSSTTAHKPFSVNGGFFDTTTGRAFFASGQIETNSGITSLVFSNSSGNLSTGTVLLYGVK